MKPGEYKVHPVDAVQTGDHQMRLDFEVVEGEHAGERIGLYIDAINMLEIAEADGHKYDMEFGRWADIVGDEAAVLRVSALRRGESVYLPSLEATVRRLT